MPVAIVGLWLSTLLASLAAETITTTTSRLAAVPDIAGMLYPAQSQRVARFGTAPGATLWSALLDSPDPSAATSLPPCSPLATRLCLEISLTSEFAGDPFVLAAFEAATPLQSLTFDNVSAAMARPVVPGTTPTPATAPPPDSSNSSSSSSSSSSGSATPPTTLWRFHADAGAGVGAGVGTGAAPMALDVLLRLRQLSQWDARRDQVLVHARVAQRATNGALTTAVEVLTLYGNAVVTHRVTRARSNQMRLALALGRNASAPDVSADDAASPLAAVEAAAGDGGRSMRWTHRDHECARCSALLLGCSVESVLAGACTFETSTAAVPTCLRETQGLTPAWFQSFLALHQLGHYEPGFPVYWSNCFYAAMTTEIGLDLPRSRRQWWSATAGFNCLAWRGCPFGPLNGGVLPTAGSPTKMAVVAAARATPSFSFVVRLAAPQWSGSLLFTFGVSRGDDGAATSLQTAAFSDSATVADIQSLVLSAFAGLEIADVSVAKSWSDDTAAWTLQVDLVNMLFLDLGARFVPADEQQQFATPPSVLVTTGPYAELQVVPFNGSLVQLVSTCETCSLHLASCQQDARCRSQALPCVFSALSTGLKRPDARTEFDAATATYRVRATDLVQPCFRQVPPAVIEPLRRALVCLARHRCSAGSTAIDAARQTTFSLQNGSQSLLVPATVTWLDTDDPSAKQSAIALQVADPFTGAGADFSASSATLASFLQAFVLRTAVESVSVSVRRQSDAQLAIDIVYSGTLLPNPQWQSEPPDDPLFAVVSDAPAELYFSFPQSAMFSIDGALAALTAFSAEPVGPTNHSWALAPECLQCSAALFGCSADAVASQQCHYANAPASLATCLRAQLPASAFVELLSATTSHALVVSAPLTRCVVQELATWRQSADAASSWALAARRRALAQSLNCFAMQRCPFGPVADAVAPAATVQLRASSFDHVLRVRIPSDVAPALSFAVQLEFRLGDVVVGNATLPGAAFRAQDVASIVSALSDALAGIAVSVSPRDTTVTEEAVGIEWTLRLRYEHVVVPDFDVQIGAQTTPSRDIAEQIVLRSTPRLVVAARDPRKVFLPGEAATPSTPTPTPSSANTPETPVPTPTPTPVPGPEPAPQPAPEPAPQPAPEPAPVIDMATRCDNAFLPLCSESRFCRTVMAPCVTTMLRNLASGSAGPGNVDLAPMFRACAAPADAPSLLDWWAPLQQYIYCLAQYEVAVSSPQAEAPSRLRFSSGFRQYAYPATTIDESDRFRLVLSGGQGSAFYSGSGESYRFEGTPAELASVLKHATHGIASSVNVTLQRNAIDSETHLVSIDFGPPFMGTLPFMVPNMDVDSNVRLYGGDSPRVVVEGGTPGSLDRLIDRLGEIAAISAAAAEQVSVPPQDPCQHCSDSFLYNCFIHEPVCAIVASCLQESFFSTNEPLFGAHVAVLPALQQCAAAQGVLIENQRGLHDYVTCVLRNQCAIGQSDDGVSTFLVLISARNVLASASSSFSASVTGELSDPSGVNGAESFTGSLDALRSALDVRTRSLANVTLFVAPSTRPNADGSFATEIQYGGYLGAMPLIAPSSGLLQDSRREPAMLFAVTLTATGTPKIGVAPSSNLFSALVTKWITPWEAMCAPYLARCSRQLESMDALTCRETILPCLSTILAVDLMPAVSDPTSLGVAGVVYNATERRLDFTERLRQCASGVSIAAFQPIAQYFGCLTRVKASLGQSDSSHSSLSTTIELRSAKQTLLVESDADSLRVYPPVDTNRNANAALETNYVQNLNTAKVVRYWVSKLGFESLADVTVTQRGTVTTTDAITGQTLVVTPLDVYVSDYVGYMPVIEGSRVSRGPTQEVSLALVFPSEHQSTRDWSRLTNAITAARLPEVSQRDCSDCAATHLANCRFCRSMVLPCLVSKLEQFPTALPAIDIASSMLYPCVASFRYVQWLPVMRFFHCMASRGCPLDASTQASDATFAVITPARYLLQILPISDTLHMEISPPNEVLNNSPDYAQRVSLELTQNAAVRRLTPVLEAMVTQIHTGGVSTTSSDADRPRVIAMEIEMEPDTSMFGLEIQYNNYSGRPPEVSGNGISVQGGWTRLFLTGQPLSYNRLLNDLRSLVQEPTVVLSGSCASCGSALFRCASEANVADGSCSFQAPNGTFARCLANRIPLSIYQSITNFEDITQTLADCFSAVHAIDAANASPLAWDELWYAASEALQCMTKSSCPMGPLPGSLTTTNMVVLSPPAPQTWQIRIDAASFYVRLRLIYDSRVEQTEWFDETAPSDDIRGLLYPLVPISATVMVSMSFDSVAWTMNVEVDGVFTRMGLAVDAGESGVSSSVQEMNPFSVRLVAMPLDKSKFTYVY
ncbi:hypothetical protein P43SY_005687 [Pythium insidiosum]|uniref:Uncharacterized protein n=1 Tax=Pythium insidiosum TaxID=114742 RepID=A0AAD5M3M3_PYTIN|nr:hypothetical protein P43SY_005687 [Pythium insidiosum]